MLDSQQVRDLRGLLTDSGYAEASSSSQGDASVHLLRAGGAQPLSSLLELFHTGDSVPRSRATKFLGGRLVNELAAADVLHADGELIGSDYRITASDDLLLVHDSTPPQRPDHVTGLNASSRTLASLTIRRQVETALDVGTGCGYQALLAARHAKQVVATDILPRALTLTALNAQLNELPNLECREGDLFEPVADEQFDLIVCNPPFIISPDSQFAFRDSGLPADTVSRSVIQAAADRLKPGGFASVLVNWGVREEEHWDVPGRQWLAGRRCDAILIRYGWPDRLAYSFNANLDLAQRDPAAYRRILERWSEHLSGLGFDRIPQVGVIMRRRRGQNWIKSFEASQPPSDGAGAQLERMFAAQDWLQTDGNDVLDQRFGLIEGHRLDQAMTFRDGSYDIRNAVMKLVAGAGVTGDVPPDMLPLLFDLPTATIRELATLLAADADDATLLTSRAAAVARELFERGLIELVS